MIKNDHQVFSSFWRVGLVVLLVSTLGLFFAGYIKKEPIRMGFVATLTGKQAELGLQERNGVQLAIETINASGGVAGRPVELIIRDDLGTPEGAKSADRELINMGVAAIIGHATSGQTTNGLQVTNPAHVVLLAPTTSTPLLTGKYEYFFRVHPTFLNAAQGFAKHIYRDRKLTKMAVLYDTDNAAYTEMYRTVFTDKYQTMGGVLVGEVAFSSSARPDFALLLSKLHESNAEGLLIISADMDAAMIAQRARLMGWQVPFFAAAWAQTMTLIYQGGQAVEGMEIEQASALDSQAPDFLIFIKHYSDRFGQFPAFGAAHGYEAAMVLAAALQKTGGKADGLRQALLEIRDFKGLVDNFSFNQYGDVVRPSYLNVIRGGKFVVCKSLIPTEP